MWQKGVLTPSTCYLLERGHMALDGLLGGCHVVVKVHHLTSSFDLIKKELIKEIKERKTKENGFSSSHNCTLHCFPFFLSFV